MRFAQSVSPLSVSLGTIAVSVERVPPGTMGGAVTIVVGEPKAIENPAAADVDARDAPETSAGAPSKGAPAE